MIKLITCIGPNGELGLNNDLIYRNKQDMKFFKEQTLDSVVIMGKNTFDSLGAWPLPNRVNVVLSEEEFSCPSTLVWNMPLQNAISNAQALFPMLDIYIIGGAYVYNQAIEKQLVDEVLITEMFEPKQADVFIDKQKLNENYKVLSVLKVLSENDKDIGLILKMKRR
jgi:dihydrofolate reductase